MVFLELVVTAAFDDNYWPAHGNLIQDNLILNSKKADMALSGISNLGNCFKGNTFQTSFPPGIQTSGECGDNIFSRGSDFQACSSIARMFMPNMHKVILKSSGLCELGQDLGQLGLKSKLIF